jgi:hypothetical protein
MTALDDDDDDDVLFNASHCSFCFCISFSDNIVGIIALTSSTDLIGRLFVMERSLDIIIAVGLPSSFRFQGKKWQAFIPTKTTRKRDYRRSENASNK